MSKQVFTLYTDNIKLDIPETNKLIYKSYLQRTETHSTLNDFIRSHTTPIPPYIDIPNSYVALLISWHGVMRILIVKIERSQLIYGQSMITVPDIRHFVLDFKYINTNNKLVKAGEQACDLLDITFDAIEDKVIENVNDNLKLIGICRNVLVEVADADKLYMHLQYDAIYGVDYNTPVVQKMSNLMTHTRGGLENITNRLVEHDLIDVNADIKTINDHIDVISEVIDHLLYMPESTGYDKARIDYDKHFDEQQ